MKNRGSLKLSPHVLGTIDMSLPHLVVHALLWRPQGSQRSNTSKILITGKSGGSLLSFRPVRIKHFLTAEVLTPGTQLRKWLSAIMSCQQQCGIATNLTLPSAFLTA